MATSEYDEHVIVDPYGRLERDGRLVFEGFVCTPEQLKTNCQFLYSVVNKPHINEPTPHVHDFPVVMAFFGANQENIRDFDAEIWFYLGGERQLITTPAMISIPPGLVHCPLIFEKVNKPVAWAEIMMTDHYEREEIDLPLIPDPAQCSNTRNLYDS